MSTLHPMWTSQPMKMAIRILMICSAVFAGVVFFTPTAAQGQTSEDLSITIGQFDAENYPEITLYINVTDQNGNNVGGLEQADFKVTEDDAAVEIVDFAGIGEARPVDIVYVFDTTGSMSEEINGVIQTSLAFADELESKGRDYRLGLVTFGDDIRGVYRSDDTLTDRAEQFKEWVSALTANGGDGDPENSYGALKRATQMQFRASAQKIFILITDAPAHRYGDDPDGGVSFTDPDLDPPRIQALLNDKSIAVYAITPAMSDFTSLVDATGGRFYDLENNPDFTAIIGEIGSTIASQYRLTYRSPRPTYDGTRRNVQIKIGQSGVSTQYSEQHLLNVQSNLLVGMVCLLPLLGALLLPGAVRFLAGAVRPPADQPAVVSAPPSPAVQQMAAPLPGSNVAVPAGSVCSNCASPLKPSARFCPRCGQVVESAAVEANSANLNPGAFQGTDESAPARVCPVCGSPVRPAAKFCNSCGNRM
jgi:VWFA-related protein